MSDESELLTKQKLLELKAFLVLYTSGMKMLGYKALVLLISLHFWGPCGASYSSDADIAGSASFIGQNGSSEFQLKGPGFTDDARGPADSIGLPPGAPIEGVAAPGEGDEFGPFQPEVCRPDNSFEFVVRKVVLDRFL